MTPWFTKVWHWVRDHLHKLDHIEATPHAIAGGVAIGVFFGFLPLTGVKTLLSIGTAWLFGLNPLAAAIAVTLHDVTLPIAPFLMTVEYKLGYWMLNTAGHPPPERVILHDLTFADLRRWTFYLDVGFPLLVGSLFFAFFTSWPSYYIVRRIVEVRQKKRREAKAAKEAQEAAVVSPVAEP